MPSFAPRQDASKKRLQVRKAALSLVLGIRRHETNVRLKKLAENYRKAYILHIKAKMHWLIESKIVGTANLGKNATPKRLKRQSITADKNLDKLENEIKKWENLSTDEIIIQIEVQ
jgi:hypothetical protein